mmetsp:Transcript_68473/g.205129  ORF Transcript_68473/g.205129 Transcript_68473/m.205129 type:complete len:81 (-) Transcript_68473:191-433(-)
MVCEYISLPGARALQPGRMRPTGRPGVCEYISLPGARTPQSQCVNASGRRFRPLLFSMEGSRRGDKSITLIGRLKRSSTG